MAHLSLLHQCQNIKGNDSTVQGKTKHTDKSCNLKNTKRQTQDPTGLYELFLLSVPIEELACVCMHVYAQADGSTTAKRAAVTHFVDSAMQTDPAVITNMYGETAAIIDSFQPSHLVSVTAQ